MYYVAKFMQFIGIVSILIGGCALDSDKLTIPLSMIFAGIAVCAIGSFVRSLYVKF